MSDLVAAACIDTERCIRAISSQPIVDEMEDMAKEVSLASLQSEEERQLARALAESRVANSVHPFLQDEEEERQLSRVLAESRADATLHLDLEGREASFIAASKTHEQKEGLLDSKVSHYYQEPRVPSLAGADSDLALALAASCSAQEQADDAALQAALQLSRAPSESVTIFPRCAKVASAATVIDSDSDVEMSMVVVEPLVGVTMAASSPDPKRPKVQVQTC
jgi:hypothetical protein